MQALFWRLRLRGFLLGWLHGLLVGLGTLGFVAAVAVVWPGIARWAVALTAGAAAVATLWTWWPLRSRYHLARRVFRQNPHLEDLLSAVELEHRLPDSLARALQDRVRQQAPALRRSLRPWPWAWRWALFGWLFALTLAALYPYGAVRAVYAALGEPWPLEPRVFLEPYPRAVFSGTEVQWTVETWQISAPPVLVFDNLDTLRPALADTLHHRFLFRKVLLTPGTVRFQAVAEGVVSPPGSLRVYDTPVVQDLRAVVTFPSYTGWPPETLAGPFQLQVLEGTRLTLEGRVALADSARIEGGCLASPVGVSADTAFRLTLPALHAPCSLSFTYYRDHLRKREPGLIRIGLTRDLPPRIVLLAPRGEIDLPEHEQVPLLAYAEDDWGLARVNAVVRLRGGSSRFPLKTFGQPGVTLDTLRVRLDLAPFDLMPGEDLVLILEAVDRAGQVAQSDPLTVRFPSLQDLYAETETALEAQEQGAEALERQTQNLVQQLERLQEEIRSKGQVDWSTREKLQQVLREQERVLQTLNRQVQQVQQALQKMDALAEVDPELAEKARRVAELFQEVATQELQKALQKLQKALASGNPRRMEQVLQELQQNQEALRQQLDRLEKVLERFRRELKLAELEERVAELAARQAELENRTARAQTPEEQQALAREQEQLRRDLQEALQEMQRLAEDLRSESPASADRLEQLRQEQGGPAEAAMQQAQDLLMQQQTAAARERQQRAVERLMNLRQSLASLRQQLGQQQKQQVVQKIRKIRRDLLFVARQQAELVENLEDPAGPPDPEALARESQALAEALEPVEEDLRSLMSQTLLLSGVLQDLLQQIQALQAEAAQALSQGAYVQARESAQAAYGLMNRTLLLLFQAENQAQQSGSGTGVEQMLQQLEQLANGQMQLNQATQGLLPLPSPVPGEMMARLQQLAEQQRALREALERLQEALQQGTGLEQALEGARRAMEQAEQALRQGHLTPEVRRQQEKALERLLQAERSIRKREFARRRRSTPGRETEPAAVAPLERATLRDQARRLLLELQRHPTNTGERRLTEAYLRTLLQLLAR